MGRFDLVIAVEGVEGPLLDAGRRCQDVVITLPQQHIGPCTGFRVADVSFHSVRA